MASSQLETDALHNDEFVELIDELLHLDTDDADSESESEAATEESAEDEKYSFSISRETANTIYNKSGEKKEFPGEKIPFTVRDSYKNIIDECAKELKLDFALNDMQYHSLYSIASSQDTLVFSPCGTGKLLVFFLGVAVLR